MFNYLSGGGIGGSSANVQNITGSSNEGKPLDKGYKRFYHISQILDCLIQRIKINGIDFRKSLFNAALTGCNEIINIRDQRIDIVQNGNIIRFGKRCCNCFQIRNNSFYIGYDSCDLR